jgi:hypothetical protein
VQGGCRNQSRSKTLASELSPAVIMRIARIAPLAVAATDVPLVIYVPEAQAIVSCGNQEVIVDLAAMDRLLGADRFVVGNLQEKAFEK